MMQIKPNFKSVNKKAWKTQLGFSVRQDNGLKNSVDDA